MSDRIRVGAIDVGTNSVHLLIADIHADGTITVVERGREQVELGAGGISSQRLAPDAFERGLRALETFHHACLSFEVDDTHVAATSAVREASNGAAFCAAVKESTGMRVRVISGREEARLIYLGARSALDFSRGRALLFDLGGGSTEFILCDPETAILSESVPLGHIRLADAFHSNERIDAEQMNALRRTIRAGLSDLKQRLRPQDLGSLVGTSGTVRALARLATFSRGDIPPEHGHGLVLQRAELEKLIAMLTERPRSTLTDLPGMDARRARTLPVGSVLVAEIMDAVGQDSLLTSELSLRDGLVIDWVMRHRPHVRLLGTVTDPRRRSVLALMERFEADVAHAERTASFALHLFDATAAIHQLPIDDRRMLEFASLLHDIGHHISGQDHHRHGQYLVHHSRMPGFTAPEIAVLGNLIRYHRTGRPRRRHPEFEALVPSARAQVRVLAAILALADAFDRSHSQNISHLDLTLSAEALQIRAHCEQPAHLERWAAMSRCEALAEVLGRVIQIEVD